MAVRLTNRQIEMVCWRHAEGGIGGHRANRGDGQEGEMAGTSRYWTLFCSHSLISLFAFHLETMNLYHLLQLVSNSVRESTVHDRNERPI